MSPRTEIVRPGQPPTRASQDPEIFRGRDLRNKPTQDRKENWESTRYTGSHLIRALLVRDQTVVAFSDWFQVNIYSTAHGFGL